VNTCLGYILIFGKFGVTPMGIEGAAIANVIARTLEFIALFIILIATKSFLLKDYVTLFPIHREFVFRFLKLAAPVAVNELFWSVGISTYNSIYAHISTEAAAATSIAYNFENLIVVPILGVGNACAILVGNQIGAEDQQEAYRTASRSLRLTIFIAIGMGLIMFFSKDLILQIYHISATTRESARLVITCLSIAMLVKSWNIVLIIGILRGGGDTRFALGLELATMWLYGVPLAWISANVFHLPVYWVVPIVLSEELIKSVLCYSRFKSKKWIHQLSRPAV
jgi:putative MATE family efflux protein